MKVSGKSLFCLLIICLVGCSSVPTPEQRAFSAEKLLNQKGWSCLNIDTPPFVLRACLSEELPNSKNSRGEDSLTVYIEGDGFAWRTYHTLSINPTPINPIGMKLALADPSLAVAYLARPCQFIPRNIWGQCQNKYWTSHRFSREVVESTDRAISFLKDKTGSQTLRLVGFSGGGAIATLVAAGRNDVVQLITVAGNLDHALWTSLHSVETLFGSLNPVDYVKNLSELKQTHLVGEKDNVVPAVVAEAFRGKNVVSAEVEILRFDDYTHTCCWADNWSAIITDVTKEK